MPSPVSPGRRFGGFQGLGGVFPDAPSIHCFPQVIESGLVCPLLQPVVHHVVDCRADLDAKSRPAGRKTRRSKGSVESPDNRVSARCTKCFRFDIRLPPGAACRLRPVALCKGSKKFSRDFPESMSPVRRRAFGIPPDRPKTRNVSSEKHHLRRYGFLRPENPLFSRVAVESPFRDPARGLRLTIFSPTMHSPDSAIERDSIQINDNTKRLRQIRQPSPQTGHHVHSQSWSTLSRQTLCSMADG
ncbi:hypothetical protein [Burkholderia territorii]|uniref:hypothetical protein n=1 Tax=Burkholderia territorii TaxID=1503055 RepID=UPI0012D9BC74|nr:hypothetical protein [Burkholderia territorii]